MIQLIFITSKKTFTGPLIFTIPIMKTIRVHRTTTGLIMQRWHVAMLVRVKEIALYISADQFDLKKKIQVYVNDILVFDKKVRPDKEVIYNEFIKTKDRSFIAAAKIVLDVKP